MRRIIVTTGLAAVCLLMLIPLAHAGRYGSAGCGLGALIFDPGKHQTFAATSNGLFGNQTFAITSGTSQCGEDGTINKVKQKVSFIESNLPRLTRDMAAGGGEYLSAYADLNGCSADARPAFFALAKARYATIYPSAETTAPELLDRFDAALTADATLRQACTRI